MSTERRVVVTGLGATTPLGGDVATTWQAALDGVSGARTLTQPWVADLDLPVTFAASLAVPPSEQLARVETRRLDPAGQYALIAAREAWADSGAAGIEPEHREIVRRARLLTPSSPLSRPSSSGSGRQARSDASAAASSPPIQ